MKLKNPIGSTYHISLVSKDGHYIEKIYRRIDFDTYILDAIVDTCEEIERARQKHIRYLLR